MKKRNGSVMVSVKSSFGLLYRHVRNLFDPGIEGTPYIKELPEAKTIHTTSRFFAGKRMMLR